MIKSKPKAYMYFKRKELNFIPPYVDYFIWQQSTNQVFVSWNDGPWALCTIKLAQLLSDLTSYTQITRKEVGYKIPKDLMEFSKKIHKY